MRAPILLLTACTGAATDTGVRGLPSTDDTGDDRPTEEICDGIDNDGDGLVDEGVTETFYGDADGDGFGGDIDTVDQCSAPEGYVPAATDCDDTDGAVYPGAPELCDGMDNDCDGVPDGCRHLGGASLRARGTEEGERVGWSLAVVRDNGGVASVLAGAPYRDLGARDAGAVYWLDPLASGDVDADTGPRVVGEQADDYLGNSVANAGDIDGDGHEDVLIGAWGAEDTQQFQGLSWLFLGPVTGSRSPASADARFVGEQQQDSAGMALTGGADLTGDGQPDLVIGAQNAGQSETGIGRAYVVAGPASGSMGLGEAAVQIDGEAAGDYAGASLLLPGDLNGDGLADLLVGAWSSDDAAAGAGTVYVLHGPLSGNIQLTDVFDRILGDTEGDKTGGAMDLAGDLDGDGHPELVLGALDASSGLGQAYVMNIPVSGAVSVDSAVARLVGEADNDHMGNAVAGPGDMNGDGQDDLAVAAFTQDTTGANAGAVYLWAGPVSGVQSGSTADRKWMGEAAGDTAGSALAALGDVDGDGRADLAIGAPEHSSAGTAVGAVYLLLGADW